MKVGHTNRDVLRWNLKKSYEAKITVPSGCFVKQDSTLKRYYYVLMLFLRKFGINTFALTLIGFKVSKRYDFRNII